MDEVDAFIISSLRRVNCDLNTCKIKDLSQEEIYRAICCCLTAIVPKFALLSCDLPQSIGERFRLGSTIASCIKDLGYRNEIGYQTVLYANEIEARRLLLFLIDLFPKEPVSKRDQVVTDPYDRLQRSVANKLRSVESIWIPPFFLHYNFNKCGGRLWQQTADFFPTTSFKSLYVDLNSDYFLINQQTPDQKTCLSSIIQNNSFLRYSIKQDSSRKIIASINAGKKKLKPTVPPKPDVLKPKSTDVETASNEKICIAEETSPTAHHTSQLLACLQQEIKVADENLRKVQTDRDSLNRSVSELEADLVSRKRFIDLLPTIDINIKKLDEYINQTETRSSKLMAQWDDYRGVLLDDIGRLKGNKKSQTPADKLRLSVLRIAETIERIESECCSKEGTLLKLEKDIENISNKDSPKIAGRSFYAKRIIEIVSNVKKHKAEIKKILDDIKRSRKEINMLNGRLDRTHKAVDMLMLDDAKRDEMIRRAYKIFTCIHQTFLSINEDVESTGHVLREIRDLEDKIEIEKQLGIEKKLETLVTSLDQIRDENEKLVKNLH